MGGAPITYFQRRNKVLAATDLKVIVWWEQMFHDGWLQTQRTSIKKD